MLRYDLELELRFEFHLPPSRRERASLDAVNKRLGKGDLR